MKIKEQFNAKGRTLYTQKIKADLIIVGGGLSGVCTAITAARQGLQIILVQDRSVLGGNASSEVRLWVLGATSHMGNNNRWAREGGVINELLIENTYRNKEGNPVIFDCILLDKVIAESNITLLLNTVVYEVEKSNPQNISAVKAFCSQNSTSYFLEAPFFCDSSGDGILGFLAGAAFRMGAEKTEEFGEKFAPTEEYGELLGHSLYFYSKDTGRPVSYHAPAFALKDLTKIPRFKSFNAQDYGCKLWWIEFGGRLDTVHDTELIKWELWKVVYGVWDYIKNSGEFPEAENLTLEWVGMIPGKRESRRFEGDYMLTQQDIVEQREHPDAVAFGGWSIDLHPADGVFSEKPGCNQWHSKGIYQIPYRCLYSKNIDNLFLTGRIISASHVAFASTRVMATGAHVGQAVGIAAKIALQQQLSARAIYEKGWVPKLQMELLKTSQHIPGYTLSDPSDLVQKATLNCSSEFAFKGFSNPIFSKPIDFGVAQMIPLQKGKTPSFHITLAATETTKCTIEFRVSSKLGNYSPDKSLSCKTYTLQKGNNQLKIDFDVYLEDDQYAFFLFHANPLIQIPFVEDRLSGMLSVFNNINPAVSNFGKQTPPEDIGVEEFEFWCPQRRPEGRNLAFELASIIRPFSIEQIRNGIDRPTKQPNCWVADPSDEHPWISLNWDTPQQIKRIDIIFDADYDHPMETVLMSHPESKMPFCIQEFSIKANGKTLYCENQNYQSFCSIQLAESVESDKLKIEFKKPNSFTAASIFAIRCYSF